MKNAMIGAAAGVAVMLSAPATMGATDQQIDELTSYAVIIGRGLACGEDIEGPMNKVGGWLLDSFAPKERGPYLRVLVAGIEHHAAQQRDGLSPDTCDAVRKTYRSMPWPE